MKRGFLNTKKAKRKLEATGDSNHLQNDPPILAARKAFLDAYDQAKRESEATGDSNHPQNDPPILAARKAFLNADQAKRKLEATADSNYPQNDSIPQDKGKEKEKSKAELPDGARLLQAPDNLDFHALPPSVKPSKDDKKRFIFLYWPRDPKGKIIKPSEIHGKEAGNGIQFWGATLYSFYYVRRIPDIDNYLTISTASKLINVMKAFGELDYATDQLALAAREPDPMEILAWDPAEAIAEHERRVFARFCPPKETPEPTEQADVEDSHMDATEVTKDLVSDLDDSMEGGQSVNGMDEAGVRDSEDSEDQSVDATDEGSAGDSEDSEGQSVDATDEGSAGDSEDSEDQSIDTTEGADAGDPEDSGGQSVDATGKPSAQQIPSSVSVESSFHPSHYPPPWPLVPFESPSPFPLQRRIPVHLLPKKLYVHDPWKVADTCGACYRSSYRCGEDEPWGSKSGLVRTYILSLPRESREMAEEYAKMAAIAEDISVEARETFIIPPRQETEGPTEEPAIRAILPKRPRRSTEVPEAHLYLSPAARLGTGNHSVVYEAELELPRDLFCERTYCQICVDEQIDIEVNRLKESGEWDRLLNEYVAKERDPSIPHSSSSSVQSPPRHVGHISVEVKSQPSETVSLVPDPAAKDDDPRNVSSDPVISRTFTYNGMIVPVHPNVQWQTPSLPDTLCKHQAEKMKPVPRTARFRVAAKLSLPYDPHLDREAKNYVKFPAHFFEHWSGYNVVPPCHDPTPIGALVPQFFGYYKPESNSTGGDSPGYLSPILLVEHCGQPIEVQKLSIDDRYECAALLFRFHYAGWLHESFAERNILMQKGHPTCSPLEETKDPYYRHREHSFRLIDFGRSLERGEDMGTSGAVEELNGKKLFGIMEFKGMT